MGNNIGLGMQSNDKDQPEQPPVITQFSPASNNSQSSNEHSSTNPPRSYPPPSHTPHSPDRSPERRNLQGSFDSEAQANRGNSEGDVEVLEFDHNYTVANNSSSVARSQDSSANTSSKGATEQPSINQAPSPGGSGGGDSSGGDSSGTDTSVGSDNDSNIDSDVEDRSSDQLVPKIKNANKSTKQRTSKNSKNKGRKVGGPKQPSEDHPLYPAQRANSQKASSTVTTFTRTSTTGQQVPLSFNATTAKGKLLDRHHWRHDPLTDSTVKKKGFPL